MKKVLTTILALLLVLTMFAGCAKEATDEKATETTKKEETKKTETKEKAEEPKELEEVSFLVWDRGSTPSDEGSIEENWYTEYVNEAVKELGITVSYVPIPRGEEGKILPIMLAGGTAPSVCYSYDKSLVSNFAKNGGLVDIGQYFDEYAPSIASDFTPEDMQNWTFFGKIYTYRPYTGGHIYSDTTWMRKDWLDTLGLDVPQTPDEFYEALKAIKASDPGNVGDDLMPFALSRGGLFWDAVVMAGFMDDAPTKAELIIPSAMWDEAKATLKYLNKLYNEGLMGDLVLDKKDEQLKQNIVKGNLGSFVHFEHFPFHSAYGSLYENLRLNVPEAEFVAAFPWKKTADSELIGAMNRNAEYAYYIFAPITETSPESVVKFFNWRYENYMLDRYGIEGEHYTLDANGVPEFDVDINAAKISWIQSQYQAFYNLFFDDISITLAVRSKTFSLSQEYLDTHTDMHLQVSRPPFIGLDTPALDKYGKSSQSKWNDEVVPVLITIASDEFDAEFDARLEEYKNSGGQAIYDEAVLVGSELFGK